MNSQNNKDHFGRTYISDAVGKADKYAAQNDKSSRAKAKQAILSELNTQLLIRAEKVKLKGRREHLLRPEEDNHISIQDIGIIQPFSHRPQR